MYVVWITFYALTISLPILPYSWKTFATVLYHNMQWPASSDVSLYVELSRTLHTNAFIYKFVCAITLFFKFSVVTTGGQRLTVLSQSPNAASNNQQQTLTKAVVKVQLNPVPAVVSPTMVFSIINLVKVYFALTFYNCRTQQRKLSLKTGIMWPQKP